jgi:hypothetical protein
MCISREKFFGFHRVVSAGGFKQVRVTLLIEEATREPNLYVSITFDDGVERLLDAMWEQIDEAEQPLVAMAGDREVKLDEMALYLIERAGWKMLRENGYYPTVWLEKRPDGHEVRLSALSRHKQVLSCPCSQNR